MIDIVRNPHKVSGGITAEEKKLLDAHAKLWIDRIMRTDPIEPDKIVPAIEGLYTAAGLEIPRVVIVDSPYVMACAGGIASTYWAYKQVIDDVTRSAIRIATLSARRATSDAARSAIRIATLRATDATYDTIDAAIRRATDDARRATDDTTRNATDDATRATLSATDDAIRRATDDDADSNFLAAIATEFCGADLANEALGEIRNWYAYYQGGNMWGQGDCYLTAMRDVLGLQLDVHDRYKYWEDAAIHGGYRFMHDKFCIVCNFPEFIKTDDQNRAHCADGPSHRWRDGWSIYSWHGVQVPEEWIMGEISAEEALSVDNVERRRAACEIVGWHNILRTLNARTIDRNNNPQIGELLEVELPSIGKERFLRVVCGTGREFALPVPPTMATALEANAWTYNVDPETYNPEVRT